MRPQRRRIPSHFTTWPRPVRTLFAATAAFLVVFPCASADSPLAPAPPSAALGLAEPERSAQELAALRQEHARQSAELRAKDAELHLAETALERAEAIRFALGLSLISLAVALGAIILLQRYRLRAERRILDETRLARDAAEEADRIKTRFLGVASHDIRAPLGNIVHLTEDLRTSPGPSASDERLDLVSSEAQRVLCLVEDLLTTAALESGKLELRPAPTDLVEITSAVIASLRWQASAKRQHLVCPPTAPALGRLTADAARLYQVVTNLVSNAIKFSPTGATITLSFTRSATHLAVCVRDEGPGLSRDDLAKLFRPFDRLSPVATAGESSHGLGLSIAHEIVRLHGGTLRVDSRPGAGTTFTAELPLPS